MLSIIFFFIGRQLVVVAFLQRLLKKLWQLLLY